jgi:hypothetical protein
MSSDDSPKQLPRGEQPQPTSARRRFTRVRSWFKTHSKWVATAAVVAVFAALGAFGALDALSIPRNEQGDCTKASAEPQGKIGSPGAGSGKLVAKLREGQREEVDFGRSSQPKDLVLYLDLSAPTVAPTYFAIHANQFVRTDDSTLQPQDIIASAQDDGTTLEINLCFLRGDGRTTPLLGDPGTYVGSVTVDDSRLQAPVTIPLIVTMQFINGGLLLWLYAAAVIPAIWSVWVISTRRDRRQGAFSLDIIRWMLQVRGIVSVVGGGVAAFAVYTATYLRDPTWGSSALQPLALYGAMFSAFVTTAGLAHLTAGTGGTDGESGSGSDAGAHNDGSLDRG